MTRLSGEFDKRVDSATWRKIVGPGQAALEAPADRVAGKKSRRPVLPTLDFGRPME